MKRSAFVAVTVFALVLVTGILLEVGLRLGGLWVESYSDRVLRFGSGKKIYRVIAMGESTTDSFWSDDRDQSWPAQLGQKLSAQLPDYQFEIYNIAQGGTSTPFLIGKLEKTLKSVEPNLVLAMMGVNDSPNFEYFHPTQLGWSSLRVVKVLKWLGKSLQLRFGGNDHLAKDAEKGLSEKFADQALTEVMNLVRESSGERAEVEKILADYLQKGTGPNYTSRLYLGSGIGLYDKYNNTRVARGLGIGQSSDAGLLNPLRLAFEHLKKSHAADPRDPMTMRFIFYCGQHLNLQDEAVAYFKASTDAGLRPDGSILSLIPRHVMHQDWVREVLANEGYKFSAENSNWKHITIRNHRRVADLMKSKNVPFIAVQYPTALRLALVNFYADQPLLQHDSMIQSFYGDYPKDLAPAKQYAHVHFVDNENFNERVREKGYDYYFKDKFTFPSGGKFGHTKFEGHELIADNVARYLLARWENEFRPR
jgi:lysophospholipase L1-like esterase